MQLIDELETLASTWATYVAEHPSIRTGDAASHFNGALMECHRQLSDTIRRARAAATADDDGVMTVQGLIDQLVKFPLELPVKICDTYPAHKHVDEVLIPESHITSRCVAIYA